MSNLHQNQSNLCLSFDIDLVLRNKNCNILFQIKYIFKNNYLWKCEKINIQKKEENELLRKKYFFYLNFQENNVWKKWLNE